MKSNFGAGGGMVVEWFELFGGYEDPAIVPEMERDRLEYSERPGFIRKLLVVGANPAGGDYAGGVYYLDDLESAASFLHWASHVHRDPDGHLFEEREYVGESHGYVCELIGHAGSDFSVPHPGAVRIQRFGNVDLPKSELQQRWANIADTFAASELLGVSLGYHAESASVLLISVSGIRCSGPELHDAALNEVASVDVVTALLGPAAGAPDDDISLWVHTVWEGYETGTTPPDAAWPNSPPLPHADYWTARSGAPASN